MNDSTKGKWTIANRGPRHLPKFEAIEAGPYTAEELIDCGSGIYETREAAEAKAEQIQRRVLRG